MTTEGTQPETPNKQVGLRFAEPLMRQFLAYQLHQITLTVDDPDKHFIDELFQRYGDDVRSQVKDYLREHTNIPVMINYPVQDTTMPCIAVVSGDESEKVEHAYLGDYGGEAEYGTLGSGGVAVTTRRVLSVPLSNTMKIYVLTNDPNLTLYLYTIVRALLYLNKTDFNKYADMRNLVISGSDLEYHPELNPEFAYFKVLTLQYESNFDIALDGVSTVGGVNIGLRVATRNQTVITSVPST